MSCLLSLHHVSQNLFYYKSIIIPAPPHLVSWNPVNGQLLGNNHGPWNPDKEPTFPYVVHQTAPSLMIPHSDLITGEDGLDRRGKLCTPCPHRCSGNIRNNGGLPLDRSRSDGRLKIKLDRTRFWNASSHRELLVNFPMNAAIKLTNMPLQGTASYMSTGSKGAWILWS